MISLVALVRDSHSRQRVSFYIFAPLTLICESVHLDEGSTPSTSTRSVVGLGLNAPTIRG
jgi:hypothetical protein